MMVVILYDEFRASRTFDAARALVSWAADSTVWSSSTSFDRLKFIDESIAGLVVDRLSLAWNLFSHALWRNSEVVIANPFSLQNSSRFWPFLSRRTLSNMPRDSVELTSSSQRPIIGLFFGKLPEELLVSLGRLFELVLFASELSSWWPRRFVRTDEEELPAVLDAVFDLLDF